MVLAKGGSELPLWAAPFRLEEKILYEILTTPIIDFSVHYSHIGMRKRS